MMPDVSACSDPAETIFQEDDAYCHSELRTLGISRIFDLKSNEFAASSIQNLKSAISKFTMSIYRRVLRYYRPFLGQTIFGLLLSLVGIGLNLLKPWPFKIIVDDFLRAGPACAGRLAHLGSPALSCPGRDPARSGESSIGSQIIFS